eukprot:TCONS_00010405-protein
MSLSKNLTVEPREDEPSHSDNMTSISHSLENAEPVQTNAQILLTQDGIVWAPGETLMLTQDEIQSLHESGVAHIRQNESGTEYGLKVNADRSLNSDDEQRIPCSVESCVVADTFTIEPPVIESRQEINYANNLTQFQVQMSIGDMNHLQKITNENVLMSQAVIHDDSMRKQEFLSPNTSMQRAKNDIVGESKQFLSNDSSNIISEDRNDLFIKNELRESKQHIDKSKGNVKSECSSSRVAKKEVTVDGTSDAMTSIVYMHLADDDSEEMVTQQTDHAIDMQKCNQKEEFLNDASIKSNSAESIVSKTDASHGTYINVDKSNLRTLAPRLQTLPLYAGAHASLGIGKSLLKPINYPSNTVPLLESGQFFEVLGRCTHCFRFSRTISYCRSEKNHREPKANVCGDCEQLGLSTVVCRRKRNHTAPNAQPLNIVINTALQIPDNVKQLCMRNYLPSCFAELHSIVIHHADITFVAPRRKSCPADEEQSTTDKVANMRKPTDYARGYLYPYTPERWKQWLKDFSTETGTNYRIRTGKRVNKKMDHHGLANHNGNIISYSTIETQLYNCALGGRPRKRKHVESIPKRKERESKLIGCSAVIHTRLLETKDGWKSLEVTVPKLSAHLPFHDPKESVEDESIVQTIDHFNPPLNSPSNENLTTTEFFDIDVQTSKMTTVNEKETLMNETRKNIKQLLLTSASLIDSIDNPNVLEDIQVQSQDFFENIFKEAKSAKKMKRSRNSNSKVSISNESDID